jgi:hypothetical protein
MDKKKKPTRPYKKPEMVIEEKVEITIAKPKLIKKKYTLITDVPINGSIYKKGSTFELTKEGAQYFKQQFYI